MRSFSAFLLLLVFCAIPSKLFADLAAIHANALPQETTILDAFDDARQLEAYSSAWSAKWDYPVPKDAVTQRIGKDLGFLRLASKAHPENEELQLLTGLVARYAYNLDVDGSYDTALTSLRAAEKLSPGDVRAPWFRASLLCGTSSPTEGAIEFLKIDASHAWNALPVAFWDDYMECASVTDMPAHVLRAADFLKKMNAQESEQRDFLAETARNRFEPYDAGKGYKPEDVWQAVKSDSDMLLTSTICGVRFHVHGDWRVNQLTLNDDSCVAYFSTGPYKAVTQNLRPSLLLLVQRPKAGESLTDFSKKFLKDGTFGPFAPSHCPAQDCFALRGLQPGMYGADGDGHGRIVFFERDEPQFPGIRFEFPIGPPTEGKQDGTNYYRPSQIQQRIPGKLYYLVLLDTAASIEEPAVKDFKFFLQNLAVE